MEFANGSEMTVWGDYPNWSDVSRFVYGRRMWLAGLILAAMFAERPIPIAEPGDERRDGHGDDLRHDRLVERRNVCEADAKQIEDADIGDISGEPDHAELERVAHELIPHPPDQRGETGEHLESLTLPPGRDGALDRLATWVR